MRHLRIPFLILALVGLIAVAGCGGSDSTDSTGDDLSNEEYAQQAASVMIEFASSFQRASASLPSASDGQESANGIDAMEDATRTAIDNYSALTPPTDAQQGHDQVVAALENLSSKLADVSDAAKSGKLKQASKALQQAGTDFQQDLAQADTSLKEAGVDLDAALSEGSTDATTG